jgi:hypothetical protein
VVTRFANSIRQHSFIDTLDGKFERPSQLAAAPSHLIDAETGRRLWFVEENGAPRASAARPERNGEISDRAYRPHGDGCNGNDGLEKAGLGDFSRIVKTVCVRSMLLREICI